MGSAFTKELWREIIPIYKSIIFHPFIKGLTDGSLREESFKFYVIQDALYLREFARSLSIAAAKAPEDDWIIMFNEHAAGALKVERALHDSFFRDFRMRKKDVATTPLAPTNLAYASYLLSVAYSSPFHEVVGALLPCYWIYWEVGKALISKGSTNSLYQRWIDTYGGEEFAGIVRAVLGLTNTVTKGLRESEKEAVKKHFLATSRYEWMFWDMGFRCERWPVGK
jgi:thiaminase/transcriptional activator TenA